MSRHSTAAAHPASDAGSRRRDRRPSARGQFKMRRCNWRSSPFRRNYKTGWKGCCLGAGDAATTWPPIGPRGMNKNQTNVSGPSTRGTSRQAGETMACKDSRYRCTPSEHAAAGSVKPIFARFAALSMRNAKVDPKRRDSLSAREHPALCANSPPREVHCGRLPVFLGAVGSFHGLVEFLQVMGFPH